MNNLREELEEEKRKIKRIEEERIRQEQELKEKDTIFQNFVDEYGMLFTEKQIESIRTIYYNYDIPITFLEQNLYKEITPDEIYRDIPYKYGEFLIEKHNVGVDDVYYIDTYLSKIQSFNLMGIFYNKIGHYINEGGISNETLDRIYETLDKNLYTNGIENIEGFTIEKTYISWGGRYEDSCNSIIIKDRLGNIIYNREENLSGWASYSLDIAHVVDNIYAIGLMYQGQIYGEKHTLLHKNVLLGRNIELINFYNNSIIDLNFISIPEQFQISKLCRFYASGLNYNTIDIEKDNNVFYKKGLTGNTNYLVFDNNKIIDLGTTETPSINIHDEDLIIVNFDNKYELFLSQYYKSIMFIITKDGVLLKPKVRYSNRNINSDDYTNIVNKKINIESFIENYEYGFDVF